MRPSFLSLVFSCFLPCLEALASFRWRQRSQCCVSLLIFFRLVCCASSLCVGGRTLTTLIGGGTSAAQSRTHNAPWTWTRTTSRLTSEGPQRTSRYSEGASMGGEWMSVEDWWGFEGGSNRLDVPRAALTTVLIMCSLVYVRPMLKGGRIGSVCTCSSL